jgi:hypothetical protein
LCSYDKPENKTLLLTVMEAGKSKIKTLACGVVTAFFLAASHGRTQKSKSEQLKEASFKWATIPCLLKVSTS